MCSKEDILALMIISEVCDEDDIESKTRKPRTWVKKWLLEKETFSSWRLLPHLIGSEPVDYKNYFRITFDELLYKVGPFITKQNTLMREAISAETRKLLSDS
ncbi:unnamed protein product [Acanthoscelides obtectus]|uniref:Uncharacterized protein n=1 Tax=Acanthoscelides obtectus TaxID=200917 RepID=A0A9P0KLN3_ACAOB|nr:unnamed protein product [Acanthoscelides obtectus]CAK1674866.1 hypothetical protein AOBTE_LOCUS29785 [Acanthoscelides obtectus]